MKILKPILIKRKVLPQTISAKYRPCCGKQGKKPGYGPFIDYKKHSSACNNRCNKPSLKNPRASANIQAHKGKNKRYDQQASSQQYEKFMLSPQPTYAP